MTTPRFTLLVPVKEGPDAKTRLGDLGDSRRAELMGAFVRDAITAARRTPMVEIRLVGDPVALAPLASELDLPVVPDEGAGDLNLALARAADRVASPGRGVAVMLADLPCLRTEDLETALSKERRAFVADAAGTGTTLLLAPSGHELEPRFGPGSAAAHRASGATAVLDPVASLRLDVDTAEDLDAAIVLGVGPHTARATAVLGRGPSA